MRIAIIGAGGIGGYFGGFLARSGADVTFVARGATLAALRERGLTVQGEHGFTTPVRVTDDIASLGVVDVLIPTTKTQSFADALGAALPTVGPETLVLTVQNGVETPDVAASVSYTHLDVYKRQSLRRRPAGRMATPASSSALVMIVVTGWSRRVRSQSRKRGLGSDLSVSERTFVSRTITGTDQRADQTRGWGA